MLWCAFAISVFAVHDVSAHGANAAQWQVVLRCTNEGVSVVSIDSIPYQQKSLRSPGEIGAAAIIEYEMEWQTSQGKKLGAFNTRIPIGRRVAFDGTSACHIYYPDPDLIVLRVEGPRDFSNATSIRFQRTQTLSAKTMEQDFPSVFLKPAFDVPLPTQTKSSREVPKGSTGPLSVRKMRHTGPDSNRLVIVFLGDGYTNTELKNGVYESHLSEFESAFDAQSPWDILFDATNLYRIDVASYESGADREDGEDGTLKDTYFNASFWTNGIERLVTLNGVGEERAVAAADEFVGPGVWDLIVVSVNSDLYGGSGGGLAVLSANAAAPEVLLHELGHTGAGLADEYSLPYPNYPAGDSEPNVDFDFNFDDIKWNVWIDSETPLPTPDNSNHDDEIGAFEGARYLDTGIFRPKHTCKMRENYSPFCEVCVEEHIVLFFEAFSITDKVTPAADSVLKLRPGGTKVRLKTLDVKPLRFTWYLNGFPIDGERGRALTLTNALLPTRSNRHELSVVISHPTERVRKTRIRQEFGWTIDNKRPTIALRADAPQTFCDEIHIEATTSETTNDFDAASITTLNCHVESFEGSGMNYSFTLVPDAAGAFSARVLAGAFHDNASNNNKPSNVVETCEETR